MPKYFINVAINIVKSCNREEKIAETVDESQYCGVDAVEAVECDDASFGSAGHGTGHMGLCGFDGASGKHEGFEAGHL